MEVTVSGKDQEVTPVAFAALWNDSDIILVAGDVEFHCHRTILCIQSPVFKAMLNGNFKEANQEKVVLEGKDPRELSAFLKLLYPARIFENALNEENVTKILALADEYQTEAVIKQCFAETAITAKNALSILPYALKHDLSVYSTCIEVAEKQIKCSNLREGIPCFDPSIRDDIWSGKCELLEDTLVKAKDNIIEFMKRLIQKENISVSSKAVCWSSHKVQVHEFHKIKGCAGCLVAYKAMFCDIVPVCTKHNKELSGVQAQGNKQLLELLQDVYALLSQRSDSLP